MLANNAPVIEVATRRRHLSFVGVGASKHLGTALALSARRLAELLAREREFSANASHQLRTPLAGLRLSLERGDVIAANAETARLSATIDHLLAAARDSLPAAEVLDIGPIVETVGIRWRALLADLDRELVVSVAPALPPVRARQGSIEQVLDIVIDNAVRHGNGSVRVTARPAPGGAVVRVDDDGPGIPAEQIAAVFERYEGAGTGIGLALARTFAEADGGRLILADPDRAGFDLVLVAAERSP